MDSKRTIWTLLCAVIFFVATALPAQAQQRYHADHDENHVISLTELLRLVQFFNLGGFHCAPSPEMSEDGFMAGPGETGSCTPHASDYDGEPWRIGIGELLRVVQFFNSGGFHDCPAMDTEDGFCPGQPPTFVTAVNAGGDTFTAEDGTVFEADQGFEGGAAESATDAVSGTSDDFLYQTCRSGDAAFSYRFGVVNGDYEVTLFFADFHHALAGQRILEVVFEGGEAETVDIAAEVGEDAALQIAWAVSVTDEQLDIDLRPVSGDAVVSALLVTRVRETQSKHTLSVTGGLGGGKYFPGAQVSIEALPASGQNFVAWVGDTAHVADVNNAATMVTMPDHDVSVIATFDAETYLLTVEDGQGDGLYAEGAAVSVSANDPPPGSVFLEWSGDTALLGNAQAPTTTLTMPARAATVTATYWAAPYTLTVGGGTGGGIYEYGDTITITAEAPLEGEEFDTWVGDTAFLNDPRLASATVTMPAQDVMVEASYVPVGLRPAENPENVLPGIDFAYYEGDWDYLPDYAELEPVATGTTYNFEMSERQQNDYFSFLYTGYLDVPVSGEYRLYTRSDDGSQLFIGDTLVVDNNGLHGARTRYGDIGLKAGKHAITVAFFERTSSQTLEVWWEGPDGQEVPIPDDALYTNPVPVYTLTVNGGVGGGTYHAGEVVHVGADVAAVGEVFDGWTGNTLHLGNPAAAATVLTMPAQDVTLTANYTAATGPTFLLEVVGGLGTNRYQVNSLARVVADAPSEGLIFDRWTGDVATMTDAYADSTGVVMPAENIRVTANYKEDREGPEIIFETHRDRDLADANGFTLMGYAEGRRDVATVYCSVDVSGTLGRVRDREVLDVGTHTGQWAIKLWADELTAGEMATVTVEAVDVAGNPSIRRIDLFLEDLSDYRWRLINRTTYGATPGLAEHLRAVGPEVWLEEQLDPESIDDSALQAMLADLEVGNIHELRYYQMIHALYSPRQLQEVMTAFWDNHFNTSYYTHYRTNHEILENNAFRENALGKFRDLLDISAHSPAMLKYLDNYDSHKEEPNENYARELLELHTMSVDGSYTQQDIVEVARIFTGWRSYEDRFFFNVPHHDYGDKVFLGETIPGTGVDEGERVLDMLAAHPDTARFISKKLIQLFVSDVPPEGLWDTCAQQFLDTDGDIGALVRTILTSDDFVNTAEHFRSKIKTPYELTCTVVRNFTAEPNMYKMTRYMDEMAMPLFANLIPTGYAEVGAEWVNSTTMLQRMRMVNEVIFNSREYNTLVNVGAWMRDNGLETPVAVLSYVMDLAFAGDYTRLEWDTAIAVLRDELGEPDPVARYDDSYECDYDVRIRRVIGLLMSYPGYQYQ
jgi:hypothetical protein